MMYKTYCRGCEAEEEMHRPIDEHFWAALQDMHDTAGHWEEWSRENDGARKYGLTDRGKEAYVGLQDKIAEGRYDD